MPQQVRDTNQDLLEALQVAVKYVVHEANGHQKAAQREVLNRARAAITLAIEPDLISVKPSREHIQAHDFAEWVMAAHKDAIYAVNELEAVATHYGAGDVRMAGVASAKQATADVTVNELIEHLRQFFPITLGRAAAAQHADRGSTKQPIGDGPCGCIVRK